LNNKTINKIEYDLRERLKELECLYNISSDIEAAENLEEMYTNSIKSIIKGFQYSDITTVEVVFDDTKYYADNYDRSTIKNSLTFDLVINCKRRGYVEVSYFENYDFLPEENKMMKEIAKRFSKATEKYELQIELEKYVNKLEELVSDKTKELGKSKTLFETLFTRAPDGVVISDLNGDIIKANSAFYKMVQYQEDDFRKLNYVKDKLYKNISEIRPYVLQKIKENGHIDGVELELLDINGNTCPVIGSFTLLDLDNHKYIEAIYKDIRIRKNLEEKLIEQNENLEKIVKDRTKDLEKQKNILEKKHIALLDITEECRISRIRLETLFKAITDTVIMIDSDFNIKEINKKVEIKNGKCYKEVFNLDIPCANCPGKMVFKEKRPITVEKKIHDDYYLLQAYPIFDPKGNVEGALEFSRVITKEKNMELQLLQTDKLASLGQLVSGIAHEINNPNAFIRGNIEIAKEAYKDILPILEDNYQKNQDLKIARLSFDVFKENFPVLLEDMAHGADRIKNIVHDLRKFAKRDEGFLTDTVDVNSTIEDCIRLVKNQIKRKAMIETNLDHNIPKIKGNIQRLEQVIVNMLINASQAMDSNQKDGAIEISTSYLKESNEIQLLINDNGVGMDENTQKQIFDPFFTTKKNKGGTGLGLSIAYGIIKEHGGRINVKSVVGEGTQFYVYLQVIDGDS